MTNMCINQEKTGKAGRRRPLDQTKSSSWSPSSPSSTMEVIDNINIADLELEMDSISEDFNEPLHKTKKPSSSSMRSNRSCNSKQRKGVRFQAEVTVRDTLHNNDFTEEETSETWYQSSEYSEIRRGVLRTLNLIKLGLFQEGDLASARGLEKYTPTGGIKESIRRRRQEAVWSVLDEQDLQVDLAEQQRLTYLVYDDKAIREVYKKHNRPSVDVARCAGRLDAQAASYDNSASVSKVESCDPKKKSTIKNIFQKSRKMCSPDTSPGAAALIPLAA